MDAEQAAALGSYLRREREAAGVSTRALAAEAGVDMAQIIRVEQGKVASPRADVLANIANFLCLPLADVFGLAGYPTPDDLPSFRPYLRAKYNHLPADAVAELERAFGEITKRYAADVAIVDEQAACDDNEGEPLS